MIISKVIIDNFKCFEHFEIDLLEDVNVIVGDNETGQSTILEAINLALPGQLSGRKVFYELTPHHFNDKSIKRFVEGINDGGGSRPSAPKIEIEVFLKDDD